MNKFITKLGEGEYKVNYIPLRVYQDFLLWRDETFSIDRIEFLQTSMFYHIFKLKNKQDIKLLQTRWFANIA